VPKTRRAFNRRRSTARFASVRTTAPVGRLRLPCARSLRPGERGVGFDGCASGLRAAFAGWHPATGASVHGRRRPFPAAVLVILSERGRISAKQPRNALVCVVRSPSLPERSNAMGVSSFCEHGGHPARQRKMMAALPLPLRTNLLGANVVNQTNKEV